MIAALWSDRCMITEKHLVISAVQVRSPELAQEIRQNLGLEGRMFGGWVVGRGSCRGSYPDLGRARKPSPERSNQNGQRVQLCFFNGGEGRRLGGSSGVQTSSTWSIESSVPRSSFLYSEMCGAKSNHLP